MKKMSQNKTRTRFFACFLALLMVFCAAACEKEQTESYVDSASEDYVNGGTILCLSPSLNISEEQIAEATNVLPESLVFTSSTSVGVNLLLDGTGDSMITLRPTADFYANRSDNLSTLLSEETVDLRVLVSANQKDLRVSLNKAIRNLTDSGKLDELYNTWVVPYTVEGRPENAEIQPEIHFYNDPVRTVRVGFSGCFPLIDYILGDGTPGGYTAAFWGAVAEELHVNLEFVRVLPESKVSCFLDDKIDVFFWHFLDVPEYCVVTDPFLTCNLAFLEVHLPESETETAK